MLIKPPLHLHLVHFKLVHVGVDDIVVVLGLGLLIMVENLVTRVVLCGLRLLVLLLSWLLLLLKHEINTLFMTVRQLRLLLRLLLLLLAVPPPIFQHDLLRLALAGKVQKRRGLVHTHLVHVHHVVDGPRGTVHVHGTGTIVNVPHVGVLHVIVQHIYRVWRIKVLLLLLLLLLLVLLLLVLLLLLLLLLGALEAHAFVGLSSVFRKQM